MKKNLFLLLALLCANFTFTLSAQELRLWGSINGSTLGPPDGYGALYSLALDGTDIRPEYKFQSFTDPNGSILNSGVYQASDGYLYGTARYGGIHGKGTIFRIRTDGTCFQKLHDFTGADGEDPHAGLIEASDGNLYGTTTGGGAYQAGTIFRISKQGQYTVLRNLNFNEPFTPRHSLIQAPNGFLYGTAPQGGPYNKGGVFKMRTDGTGYEIVVGFDGTNGAFAEGGLTTSDGNFYAAAASGGASDGGRIYYIDPTNDSFHTVFEFTAFTNHGKNPTSKLLESADGYLYGTTLNGGTNFGGTLYRVKKDGTDFSVRHNFGSIPNDGVLPEPGLVQLPNGKLFGITVIGGAFNGGIIYTLESDGSNYTKIHDITADLGRGPRYKLELVTRMAPLEPINITSIIAPPDPIDIGSVVVSVDFTGTATSSSVSWGDGTTSSGEFVSASSLTASHHYASAGTYEITAQLSNACATATKTIQVVIPEVVEHIVITNVTAPVAPVPVGSVSIGVEFTGPATSSSINWGDGTAAPGVFGSAGSLTANHHYTSPGVYEVTIVLSSDAGGTASHTIQYIVVYDPTGGFVTGGGHFTSPAGAYLAHPEISGRAQFGFVAKYIKGNSIPTGNTVFKLLSNNLSFQSTSLEWLVVAGYKAMYRGEGSLNGDAGYRFSVSAVDGNRKIETGPDKFRIMIWNSSGDLVYDNQLGADEIAEPTTAIDEGSIVIHAAASTQEGSSASSYPSPFKNKLLVEYNTADKTPVRFEIVSIMGAPLISETMSRASDGLYELSVDDPYQGLVLIRISQGASSTVIKVMKE
jgi:uncharacterized repeat protein (TIGR03803 family)